MSKVASPPCQESFPSGVPLNGHSVTPPGSKNLNPTVNFLPLASLTNIELRGILILHC